jgi:hypothetical protein
MGDTKRRKERGRVCERKIDRRKRRQTIERGGLPGNLMSTQHQPPNLYDGLFFVGLHLYEPRAHLQQRDTAILTTARHVCASRRRFQAANGAVGNLVLFFDGPKKFSEAYESRGRRKS